jgi:hypothetical protein
MKRNHWFSASILGLSSFLLCAALAVGGAVPFSTEKLSDVRCRSERTEEEVYSLYKYEFTKPPEEDEGLRDKLVVLAVERPMTPEGKERIWQDAANDILTGVYPLTHWAGGLLCGQEKDAGWVVVLASASNHVWINIYDIELSNSIANPFPSQRMSNNFAVMDEDRPQSVASLAARLPLDDCELNQAEAVWEAGEISLRLYRKSDPCTQYVLRFDPIKKKFKDIPEKWCLE